MIVAYLPLLLHATTLCHGEDPVDLKYQQSLMGSHLQTPQGNCNEDLTFPFKGNKKEAEKLRSYKDSLK